jgi:cytochrome c556
MNIISTARVMLAAAALGGTALAAEAAPPAGGPGWTGMTHPKDVIAARQALMQEIEHVMQPIDTAEVEDPADLAALASAARVISTLLLTAPHLFPPTTNLYDPKAPIPETLALPAIWNDFSTFYTLAAASAAAAKTMSETTGKEALRARGRSLRATCDSCHALYLRPYQPSTAGDADTGFDFDSALKK